MGVRASPAGLQMPLFMRFHVTLLYTDFFCFRLRMALLLMYPTVEGRWAIFPVLSSLPCFLPLSFQRVDVTSVAAIACSIHVRFFGGGESTVTT